MFAYPTISKLKTLPLREQPAYRVSANAAACSLSELLAAVIGGTQQIEISEALLARFSGDLQRIYHAPIQQIASIRSTTIRITHERQLEMPTERSAAAATLSLD